MFDRVDKIFLKNNEKEVDFTFLENIWIIDKPTDETTMKIYDKLLYSFPFVYFGFMELIKNHVQLVEELSSNDDYYDSIMSVNKYPISESASKDKFVERFKDWFDDLQVKKIMLWDKIKHVEEITDTWLPDIKNYPKH